MNLHRLSTFSLRTILIGVAGLAILAATSLDSDRPATVQADPAFGNVKVNPPSGVIILEGYVFKIPVLLTTCVETGGITDTASGGALNTLQDTGMNWTTNQWAGWDVMLTSGPNSPQTRSIVSNTNNTLTVSPSWGDELDSGTATGGTTTTLVDAGSGWTTNEFAGKTVEITSPGGPQTRTITSNTADTLTVSSAYATYITRTATGGSATTLVDTGASYGTSSQQVNRVVQITAGAAAGQTRRIISHTNTALTVEGTWQTSGGGSATSATSTTLTDASASWTPNAFVGMNVELLSGAGNGQSKVITSNTATTITISGSWTTTPGFGDFYRVLQLPNSSSQYIVRDGAAAGTTYVIKQFANPTGTTGYQLFKGHCRPAGYDVTVGYDESRYSVVFEGGFSTGGNTSTTLKDTTQSWKINQWAGTRVYISGGVGFDQWRIIASNTADTLTVSPAWTTIPASGSVYQVGGIADGGFLPGGGRTITCPFGGQYGSGTASLECVTYGAPGTALPLPPTGVGNLVNVVFLAEGRGIAQFTLTTNLLEVDGTSIPADVVSGARRVILCPDSNTSGTSNGRINSGDQLFMAQAWGQGTGDPLYTITKDPDESGKINSADQLLLAAVFNQYCIQP